MEETKYQLLHPGADALLAMFAEKNMFQVNCPICGAKVCRAAECSQMRTFCPKCRHLLDIDITGGRICVSYSEETRGSLKAKAAQDAKERNKADAALRRQRKANRNKAMN